MEEIVPGLWHWRAYHEGIGAVVHSAFVARSGTLIDPMEPDEGVEWFAADRTPRRIVLTNRHHLRHSAGFVERFACPVLCHRAGLHAFTPRLDVRGFEFGDRLAEDVMAHELGSITPEEAALHIDAGPGVLAFADGVVRRGEGGLSFVPDALLGSDPQAVKDGVRASVRALLELPFDALILAHGEPMARGGRAALEAFAAGDGGAG